MASVLQTDQWAAFKEKYGWQSRRVDGVLILSRPILAGKSMWYAPETEITGAPAIEQLVAAVRDQATKEHVFLFRLELAVPYSESCMVAVEEHCALSSLVKLEPAAGARVDVRPDTE